MAEASITYFPVGNGDTSLIRLKDGTSILIDVCMASDDEDKYDVHGHLIGELRSEKGVPHLDAFILTHAHVRKKRLVDLCGDH
jgi:beta-lactamase superfamily II metal-dependent hydrolase